MLKNNNMVSSIRFFFGKSKVLGSTMKEEIITPVDSVDNIAKIYDEKILFSYLEDAYKNHVKKLEIQCLDKEYQKLTGNQVVTPLSSVEEVNKQEISGKKLFHYLEDAYEQNILELAKQSKEPINSQEPKKIFQEIKNFFQSKKYIETERPRAKISVLH